MSNNTLHAIILAGGLGKRMSKDKAKVLHHIRNRPMIFYVIENALAIGASRIFIVVGKYHQQILNEIKPLFSSENFDKFVFVKQPETLVNGELCSLGTGDAVRSCLSYFQEYNLPIHTKFIILSGDVPFIDLDELNSFSKLNNSIMVSFGENPKGYGRVFLNNQGFLDNIIEHPLCNQQQLLCTTVNAGIYNLNYQILQQTIPNIEINPVKKEFFLTDFYKYTDTPISCFHLSHIPKNINTLEDLQSFQ